MCLFVCLCVCVCVHMCVKGGRDSQSVLILLHYNVWTMTMLLAANMSVLYFSYYSTASMWPEMNECSFRDEHV